MCDSRQADNNIFLNPAIRRIPVVTRLFFLSSYKSQEGGSRLNTNLWLPNTFD